MFLSYRDISASYLRPCRAAESGACQEEICWIAPAAQGEAGMLVRIGWFSGKLHGHRHLHLISKKLAGSHGKASCWRLQDE